MKKKNKEKARKILEEMKGITKQQKNLKWDFFGIRFMKLANKWSEYESELSRLCFG